MSLNDGAARDVLVPNLKECDVNQLPEECNGSGYAKQGELGDGFYPCQGCPSCKPAARKSLPPLKARAAIIAPIAKVAPRRTVKIKIEDEDGVMREAEIPPPEAMVHASDADTLRPDDRHGMIPLEERETVASIEAPEAETGTDNRTAKSGGKSTGNDFYLTPGGFLVAMRKLGNIELDPCGSAAGSLVLADREYQIERGEDGLALSWKVKLGNLCYFNPPYSQTRKWIEKADAEFKQHMSSSVGLVAARVGTIAAQNMHAKFVCFLKGRLTFLNPETRSPPLDKKGKPTGAMFDSMVIYYGLNEKKFREVFEPLGKVVRWS
jgi:hypothetical protein